MAVPSQQSYRPVIATKRGPNQLGGATWRPCQKEATCVHQMGDSITSYWFSSEVASSVQETTGSNRGCTINLKNLDVTFEKKFRI